MNGFDTEANVLGGPPKLPSATVVPCLGCVGGKNKHEATETG